MHSSASGHLGGFHVLDIASSAAVNVGMHASLSLMAFPAYMSSSGVPVSYGTSTFSFFKESPYCSP